MFRLKEAIELANLAGRKISKQELAAKLWTGANPVSSRVMMSRLLRGDAEKIRIEWVEVICRETGVDANFLFGIK